MPEDEPDTSEGRPTGTLSGRLFDDYGDDVALTWGEVMKARAEDLGPPSAAPPISALR
jgi:hypothetical protein